MKICRLLLIALFLVSHPCHAFHKTWQLGGDIKLQFQSESPIVYTEKERVQLAAHLPGLKELGDSPVQPTLLINHHYVAGPDVQLAQLDGKVEVYADWSGELPPDFVHLLYGACRLKWLQKGILPVHAACIGNEQDGYILLMGAPGSGKTSLTLHNATNHQFNVFSGDKTLLQFNEVGKLEAIAGTHTMTVRNKDLKRWTNVPKVNAHRFGDRLAFQLPDHVYSPNKRVPIKQIYLVRINAGEHAISQLTPLSALHTLYPFFLDKQREDVLIAGDQALFDGAINKQTREKVAHQLFKALETTPVYQVTGSLEEVSSSIHSHLLVPQQKPFVPKKVLFGICGIGNGHINRQLPLLKYLLDQGHHLMVFTYGEGLTFFNERFSTHPHLTVIPVANPYYVGALGGLDFEATATSEKNSVNFNRINALAMHRATKEFGRPDLVISDYEMVAAQYAYVKRAPLVTLDQQSKYLVGDFPDELYHTSYRDEVERLNLFFPKATKRMAVSFFQVEKVNDIAVDILPPTIRPEIVAAKGKARSAKSSLLVYITAQQLGHQPIDEWMETLRTSLPEPFEAHIFLPRRLPLPVSDSHLHFYHHGDHRFDALLSAAHGIVSTAGHTLLSEAMYLEKPVYALPLPLYEQQLNAEVIANGGFGLIEQQLSKQGLHTFLSRLDHYAENIRQDQKRLFKGTGNVLIIEKINQLLGLTHCQQREHKTEVKYLIPDLSQVDSSIVEALKSGKEHPDILRRGFVVQEYLAVTKQNLINIDQAIQSAAIPFGSRDQLDAFLFPGKTQEIRLMRKSIKEGGEIKEIYQVTIQGPGRVSSEKMETPERLDQEQIEKLKEIFHSFRDEVNYVARKIFFEIQARDPQGELLICSDGTARSIEIDAFLSQVDGRIEPLFIDGEIKFRESDQERAIALASAFRQDATQHPSYFGIDLTDQQRTKTRNITLTGISPSIRAALEDQSLSNQFHVAKIVSEFKRWASPQIARLTLDPPAYPLGVYLKKKVLMNAEPFGFGPTAAIAEFFPYLRDHIATLSYIGTGHTLDLQRKLPYDHVYDYNGVDDFLKIAKEYDIFITACDFETAEWAKSLGLKVVIYDPLTWYWTTLPNIIQEADYYVAQNFVGVAGRLEKESHKFPENSVVPAIIPGLYDKENQDEPSTLLVNMGGLRNPYLEDEDLIAFARIVCRTIHDALEDEFEQTVYLSSRSIAHSVEDICSVSTLQPHQVQKILAASQLAIMTSGLGNLYEASSMQKKVVWLPPANDSQGQQIKLLQQNQMMDFAIDWHDLLEKEEPIDYFAPQQEVLKHIAERIKRLSRDRHAQAKFKTLLKTAHLKAKAMQTTTPNLAKLAGTYEVGGAKQAAENILQWICSLTPKRT